MNLTPQQAQAIRELAQSITAPADQEFERFARELLVGRVVDHDSPFGGRVVHGAAVQRGTELVLVVRIPNLITT